MCESQIYSLQKQIETLMMDIAYLKARAAFVSANMERRNIADAVEGNTGDMCVNLEDVLSTVFVEKSAISLSFESESLKNISFGKSDTESTRRKNWIVRLLQKIETTDGQLYKLTEEKNDLCADIQELEKQIIREENKIQEKVPIELDNRRKMTNDEAYQRERIKLVKRVATMNAVSDLISNLCFTCNVKMSEHPLLLELIRITRKPTTLDFL